MDGRRDRSSTAPRTGDGGIISPEPEPAVDLRLAIFGGAFDPIHRAHLTLARAAAERFRLSRLFLVPAVNPPHKKMIAEYEHRFQMVELAVENDPVLCGSRLDAGREYSYSVDTIERLRKQVPADARIFFLIGADAFADIRTWVRWPDVIRSVEFVVASRPGYQYDVPQGAIVHPMDWLELSISSSEIRSQLSRGISPAEVPPSVLNYIREHGLYTDKSL